MDRMGYPKGLIRYTTENSVAGKPTHVLRPRMYVYAAVLGALFAALVVSIALRTPLKIDVLRDRNALYRETGEGLVENVYTLKLINMDAQAHRLQVSVSGIPGVNLVMEEEDVEVGAGAVLSVAARVRVDPSRLDGRSHAITFTATDRDDANVTVDHEARFLGPRPDE